jgi:DsbC/DsbD-like thiol-disulfide interchange protein
MEYLSKWQFMSFRAIGSSFGHHKFGATLKAMWKPICPLSGRPQRFGSIAAFSLLLLLAPAGGSSAQDASSWDSDQRSAIRLIAGSTGNGQLAFRAGIEMRIDKGWKTYWRYAGDSGLPPSFDFAGSENVKSVTVLWPTPRRFADGVGGNSIGYTDNIVFPLRVLPKQPDRPVTLKLNASYGVCEKVCIPASGKAQLQLTRRQSSEDAALTQAELRVPKPVALGAPGALSIRAVRRETSGSRQRVIVDVIAPDGMEADLFAEGPTPQWSLPLPEPAGNGPGGNRRFAFDVDGVPPGSAIVGAPITLTLVARDDAIEVTTRLD